MNKLHICRDIQEEEKLSALFRHVGMYLIDCEDQNQNVSRNSRVSHRPRQPGYRFEVIDFNDLTLCRWYIKRFAPCYSALARYGTQLCLPEISTGLVQRDELKIVSVGGGPGSDALGFCSAISRFCAHFNHIELIVIEKASGWNFAFEEAVTCVLQHDYGSVSDCFRNLFLTTKFFTADVSAPNLPKDVESADIVLMTKVLSAVPTAEKDLILRNVFSSMKPGAIFLFIDTDGHVVDKNSSGMIPLYRRARDVFHYRQRNDTVSIAQSVFEIRALKKVHPGPEQNVIWMPMQVFSHVLPRTQ